MSFAELIAQAGSCFPNQNAFLVPKRSPSGELLEEWNPVTFRQLVLDVDTYARHWSAALAWDGVRKRDVVTLWIHGFTYHDAVQLMALAKAGFIPQVIPGRLPNVRTIYELMKISRAKALLYHPTLGPATDCPVAAHPLRDVSPADIPASSLPSEQLDVKLDDIEIIHHTSGSTGNLPKLVHLNRRWVERAIVKQSVCFAAKNTPQDVTIWLGSVAHIGQWLMLMASLKCGTCTVQATQFPYTIPQFLTMYKHCAVNRLQIFAPLLSALLQVSRQNTELRTALLSLSEIGHTGASLPQVDTEWGLKNGIRLQNFLATTEGAILMRSVNGTADAAPHLLRPLEGVRCAFVPVEGGSSGSSTTPSDGNYSETQYRLLELVVHSDSADCPPPAFRSPTDGHWHTGDLFEEILPGRYDYRGRNDDWINMSNVALCNTKVIEDAIRASCGDVVSECVVVGNGRPCPAVFLEVRPSAVGKDVEVKQTVVERTREFNARRYLNERVPEEELIFVVKEGELPKTAKGNIRRKAVEEVYKDVLDRVYDVVGTSIYKAKL